MLCIMVRKYLFCTAFLIFSLSSLAQEGPSLGDIARNLKAQKGDVQSVPATPATPSTPVQAQRSAVSVPTVMSPEVEELIVPDLNADVATDVHGLEKQEAAIREMLYQGKFNEIDRLAADFRSTKARFTGGYWKVHMIYRAIESPVDGPKAGETEWTNHIALLEQWKNQYPNSVTPRIALAEAYHDYGWKARGTSYADKVTEEGWQLLAERLHKERVILEEAETLREKCPEWFVAMIEVARGEGWEPPALGALLKKAMAFEPDYYYYYRMVADSMLPKWGGGESDSAQFAKAVADQIGGKKGDMIYFEIATTIICSCTEKGLHEMSWQRIKDGYAALRELHGDTISHKNEMALMAFKAEDFDYAVAVFTQIGDQWDKDVWLTNNRYSNSRLRAAQSRTARIMKEAKQNSQSPEGYMFSNMLGAQMESQYHQKLVECMKKQPEYNSPFVWVLMKLSQEGSLQEMIMGATSGPVACFRPQLEKAALPAPPKPDYWVTVKIKAQ